MKDNIKEDVNTLGWRGIEFNRSWANYNKDIKPGFSAFSGAMSWIQPMAGSRSCRSWSDSIRRLPTRFRSSFPAVSALDVSIQAQILRLLQDLQAQLGLAYLFISHNLAVVEHMSDHIGVMHLGKRIEYAPVKEIFQAPQQEYTRADPERTLHSAARRTAYSPAAPR